jgi:hypothetical protein
MCCGICIRNHFSTALLCEGHGRPMPASSHLFFKNPGLVPDYGRIEFRTVFINHEKESLYTPASSHARTASPGMIGNYYAVNDTFAV